MAIVSRAPDPTGKKRGKQPGAQLLPGSKLSARELRKVHLGVFRERNPLG